ncbi:MAG: hypothetical protein C0502_11105 [Opitutus sp.]|nr:hypothetical protein [Opitutus sp.]
MFRAYHSETAGRALVTMQELNGPERKCRHYLWQLSPGGAKSGIRKFPSVVLRTGNLPLAVLEQVIDGWVAAQR